MEDYDVTIEAQEKDVMQWLGNFLAMAQGLPLRKSSGRARRTAPPRSRRTSR